MVDNNRKRATVIGLISVATIVVVALIVANRAQSNRPSAPQSVNASAGNGFANVSWSRPTSTGGRELTRYIVTPHPANGACVTTAATTTCTIWELTNGTSYTFTVVAKNAKGAGPSSSPSSAVTPRTSIRVLPICDVGVVRPTKAVSAQVVAAVSAYYAARHLTPIKFVRSQETILNVHEWPVGFNYCRYVGAGVSGEGGFVPSNATAAVMVLVDHKPDPVTGFSTHFVSVALIPSVGWRVVGEFTGWL